MLVTKPDSYDILRGNSFILTDNRIACEEKSLMVADPCQLKGYGRKIVI